MTVPNPNAAASWPATGIHATAERHRQLARMWRKHGGEPGYPTVARAKQMAINHEQAVKLITIRLAKAGITCRPCWQRRQSLLNCRGSRRREIGASRCS